MTQEALEGFPLSLQQRHVWRLQKEGSAYGAQCAVLLTGRLNRTAFHEAIQHVVQRHEILRTTFHGVAGLEFPLQVIAERGSPGWQELDLRGVDQQGQAAQIDALLQHECRILWDATHGPLLRFALLALAAQQHLLLISLSALCADAWTLTHLVQEIGQVYAAAPQQATLPDVPLQYADFAAWQQDILADADGEAGRAYWRMHNLSTAAGLTLPGVSQPVRSAGDVPQTLPVTLPADALTWLEALAQQYETSVAVCLLVCWQTLLWRFSGQSDVCVGYVCDGRKYGPVPVDDG
jgi:hypothetical protein